MSTPADYKALVCIDLVGGMDGFNLLIPTDNTLYGMYASGRAFYALAKTTLLPLAGTNFGLNPGMSNLQRIWNQNKAAFVTNVGTLVQPLTKAQYNTGATTIIPAQLFSHADQSAQWFSGRPDNTTSERTGVLGRIADNVTNLNGILPHSMQVAISEPSNSMLPGQTVDYITIGVDGAPSLRGFGDAPIGAGSSSDRVKFAALQTILNAPRNNLFDATYGLLFKDSIAQAEYVKTTLTGSGSFTFPDTPIGKQLKMVARLISAGSDSKFKRQCFFVNHESYDFHAEGPATLTAKLAELDAAIGAFYDALVTLGATDKVIGFTISDFGRTFKPNDQGTDHGWGSNHFAFGAVNKGIYGTYPDLVLGGNQDADSLGRWIPTTGLDQYYAPFAKWMGVTNAQLPIALPLLSRFPVGALALA